MGEKKLSNDEPVDAEKDPIDWAIASNLTGGDEDLLDELAALFPEESSRHAETIRSALQLGDQDALQRAAHTLKSSAKLFGAEALSALAQQIEALAGQAKIEQVENILPELDSELERVILAMKRRREQ